MSAKDTNQKCGLILCVALAIVTTLSLSFLLKLISLNIFTPLLILVFGLSLLLLVYDYC
ncbi:MAG: hypothetical protein QXV60_01910 [Nitrososphaerota archaeon]